MRLEKQKHTYRLEADLWLPLPRDELFPFFSDAYNLERITPPLLRFEVLTPKPIEMRAGTLIDYKLRVRGAPIRWRTQITEWDPPRRFVDEQLRGPYRLWRHTHRFEPADGGTRCIDIVEYRVPGGPLAPLIHQLAVKRDVQAIFRYRAQVLSELFGNGAAADDA